MARKKQGNVMFKVQRKQCPTCIYGKRSGVRRSIAQLEAQIADPHMPGFFLGYRVCHHSDGVCCAGFWRRWKDHFTLGQIAQRLGWVRYVEVDILTRS
jgi:hypothetical protein